MVEHFQFPCNLGGHIPSSRADLLCVQTMQELPVLRIFNAHTDVEACDCTQEGCANTVRDLHRKL